MLAGRRIIAEAERWYRVRLMTRDGLYNDLLADFAPHERALLILLRHECRAGLQSEVTERRAKKGVTRWIR